MSAPRPSEADAEALAAHVHVYTRRDVDLLPHRCIVTGCTHRINTIERAWSA